MPRLPRDVSGEALIAALRRAGYVPVRQSGSHVRLSLGADTAPVTVPLHQSLRLGTLNGILREVEEQTGISRQGLLDLLR